MTRSEVLFEAAQRVLPGGVNSPVRACRAVGTYPRFLERGQGSRVWDADGKEYIDLIVSDIMMPRMDGLTLVRALRESGCTTPVLFLTSRDSVEDKVEGLETGADYYLVKPFHMQELLAVVRVMARKYTDTRTNVYTLADLSVDVRAHTAVRAGRVIELTSREYALLEYMIRNKGVVLSRERIENNLWNYDYEGGTNVVDVYVGYLRKKIDAGFSKKLIHTVWGTGWVLRED